ncbi:hypothetical protein KC19_3G247900 [Ceratodon purpureus]|uniref:Uncharacterized protein n=1 Tax=Ceratodon purpureus TaxID=3225 RepID=A0A8T0H5Y9_CERPU|nr:hypothetical protein KC19_12G136600 [Ceratodon purpureus]KAG0565588.1 hypothetical protein KC19_8G201600 [Ceratodon purpureus]KAG0566477.1 hypothetical protein KC19_7G066800 [Ceratodon purpureus]KAG0584122.1 hypothetical protein KC19_3G186900 [Ceratodon purpureus]KAG0584979.1 hypothetical protein KC19_3G247900 [Ceratodon purpureus]
MVHFTVLTLCGRVSELHSLVGGLRCLRGFGRKCEIFLSECLLILCLRGCVAGDLVCEGILLEQTLVRGFSVSNFQAFDRTGFRVLRFRASRLHRWTCCYRVT